MGAWRLSVRSSFELLTPRMFRTQAQPALVAGATTTGAGRGHALTGSPRPYRIPRERFRNRRQKAEVCRALLGHVGLGDAWTSEGPVYGDELELREALATLPRDSLTVLLVCWALWDETAILAVSDLLCLGERELEAVGELFRALAQGFDEVDRWLSRWAPDPA